MVLRSTVHHALFQPVDQTSTQQGMGLRAIARTMVFFQKVCTVAMTPPVRSPRQDVVEDLSVRLGFNDDRGYVQCSDIHEP